MDNYTKCESCNGTGLIHFFNGESRFLLSQEECPDCAGTGLASVQYPNSDDDTDTTKKE